MTGLKLLITACSRDQLVEILGALKGILGQGRSECSPPVTCVQAKVCNPVLDYSVRFPVSSKCRIEG